MDKKRIYVVGACQGAGATFVATSLAFSMGNIINGVTYVESPRSNVFKEEPLVLNELSLEKIESKNLRMYSNVYWNIYDKCKGQTRETDFSKIKDGYIIYDSPADYRNCELIICVIDALPSKAMASIKKVNHLKTYFSNKTIWVLNRNILSNARAIEQLLGIRFDFMIPMERQEAFYKAEHYGKPLQTSKLFSEDIKESVENIAKYIISLY